MLDLSGASGQLNGHETLRLYHELGKILLGEVPGVDGKKQDYHPVTGWTRNVREVIYDTLDGLGMRPIPGAPLNPHPYETLRTRVEEIPEEVILGAQIPAENWSVRFGVYEKLVENKVFARSTPFGNSAREFIDREMDRNGIRSTRFSPQYAGVVADVLNARRV